jgi:hypothetical protein
MMLGAGLRPDPVHDTITLRGDHPRHIEQWPARYSIGAVAEVVESGGGVVSGLFNEP